jgi:hypothetical protein
VHPQAGQYCLIRLLLMRALARLALNSKMKAVNESGAGGVWLQA